MTTRAINAPRFIELTRYDSSVKIKVNIEHISLYQDRAIWLLGNPVAITVQESVETIKGLISN